MAEALWNEEGFVPAALTREYELVTCLQSDATHAAYLCRRKSDGILCLLKTAHTPERVRQLITDDETLRTLNAGGGDKNLFPKPVALTVEGEDACQVRTWIDGQSLDQYVESAYRGTGLPKEEALDITAALLEQVNLMHRLNPPIIHRDIKPQNVILDAQGVPHLIDFGIARQWKSGQAFDTQVNGTEEIAAPEQFGFRQTDERSDVYAIGVLLRYLLTEEYDRPDDAVLPMRVARVIRKATRFDPSRRYQSAERMLRAVNRLRRPRRWRCLCLAAIALSLVAAGLFVHEGSAYTFKEPLIEQAVRIQLNKPEGAITLHDLRKVESLHIFGRRIYEDETQFLFLGEYVFPVHQGVAADALWQENGRIQRLDDLAAMPNCREVCLYRQEISDISALKGSRIERLGIGYNPVTDLEPLRGNGRLQYLNLSCLTIDDPTLITSITNLESLCLSGVGLFPFQALSGLPLRTLNLADAYCDEDHWLTDCEGLKELTLSKLYPGMLRTLSRMRLETLTVTHTEEVTLRDLEALPTLTCLRYDAGEAEEALTNEPLMFPNLRELDLKGMRLSSLNALKALSTLETLGIYASSVMEYAGLERLDHLRTIYTTDEQRQALETRYPDAEWDYQ